MKMDTLRLTRKLVSIPSYLDKKVNEKKIGDFVYKYLKKNTYLEVRKQKVERDRFNIIAGDGEKPRLLLIAHLDTVEPRGWERNAFKGVIKGKRFYGLGSMDMKGGMAAMLAAVKTSKKTKGLMLLFYCDEEYDFKGMKKFVQEYKISPKLAVSAEPTDLKIWNGARGIIKVSFQVNGLTAPASRPDQGKNAILAAIEATKNLEKIFKKYQTRILGPSTCNLASIVGGLNKGNKIDQKGDAVADVARVLLDIRTADPGLNAKVIKKNLADFLTKKGVKLTDFIIYHDLSTFYTSPFELKLAQKAIRNIVGRVEYLNLQKMGYQDIQMINEKLKVPSLSFGPRGGRRHQPNEWVNVQDLDKVKKIFQNIIRRYCSLI
jgi:succinyl-diaminopimelate desuccinylase